MPTSFGYRYAQLAVLICVNLPGSIQKAEAQMVAPQSQGRACRAVVLQGQVKAGEPFSGDIGNGLKFTLQPIHSGWIARVLPAAGLPTEPDYAEVATPPYRSVTPLSISTDFAFRAQDAIGWNPREFRFALDRGSYQKLSSFYKETSAASPGEVTTASGMRLGELLAGTGSGSLRLVDARLIPGVADQNSQAAAVASHFSSTAHTIEEPAGGKASPLGELLWIRFRVELQIPSSAGRGSSCSF